MKRYQSVILAFVFISTLFSSFHYHDDGHTSEDCQVCVLQHNLSSADLNYEEPLVKVEVSFEVPLYIASLRSAKTLKSFNSRAPPSFF